MNPTIRRAGAGAIAFILLSIGFSVLCAPGAAADGAFNTEVIVHEGSSSQTQPSIAVDGNGTAYIVWLEDGNVLFSKTTDAGVSFNYPIILNNATSINPSIAVVKNNVFIVWSEVNSIYLAKSKDEGLSFNSSLLTYNNSGMFLYPSITVDVRGNIYIAWEKALGGPLSYVYFTRSIDNAITFNEPLLITGASSVRMRPSITCDFHGNVFLTWIEGDNLGYSLRFSMSKNEGISFEPPLIISKHIDGTGDYIGEITHVDRAIAVSPNGNIFIVWSNNGIFINRSIDGGLSFSSGIKLNDMGSTGAKPSISVDIYGHVHVVWTGDVASTTAIYYDVSTDGGETFGTDIKLNSGSAPISFHDTSPSISVADNGGIYAVWQAQRSGTGSDIIFDIYFTTTNNPVFPVTLNQPAGITAGSMNLTWSRSIGPDFGRYELHMATHAGFTISGSTLVASLADETATGYTVTDLAENITYYFKVRLHGAEGPYSDSNEVFARTADVPPAPVILYEPTDITNCSMVLTWSRNANSDFAGYELHMSENADFVISPSTLVATITDQNATTYNVTGLAEDETYYFKVRVSDAGGSHTDSNEVSGKTLEDEKEAAAVQKDFLSILGDNYPIIILVLLILTVAIMATVKRQWIMNRIRGEKGRNEHERNEAKD